MTITEVYECINKGIKVYWGNDNYQVLITTARKGCEYQQNHFTNIGGDLLEIRCMSNWFGGLMGETELKDVYIK